jgi:SAM-dependent methyltransferase
MKASMLQKQLYESKDGASDLISRTPRVRMVRQIMGTLPSGKILDVGCGDGTILAPLMEKHDVFGMDISDVAVAKAKTAGLKATQHDIEDPFPYESSTFDAIFCGETIEHQVDTDWLLSEINRVLKPDGQLILTYPNIRTPVGIFMLAFLDMPPMFAARYRAPHYRDFTLRTIKIALANNGFKLTKAWGCFFYVPGIGECASALASILPRFSSAVLVQSRKIETVRYQKETSIGRIY